MLLLRMNLATLSDQELLSGLKQTVATERVLVAPVVAYLGEVERRRLNAARQHFGEDFIAQKIDQRRRRSSPPPTDDSPFAQLERALRHLGYRASETDRALESLRSRIEREPQRPIEQLLREALAILR